MQKKGIILRKMTPEEEERVNAFIPGAETHAYSIVPYPHGIKARSAWCREFTRKMNELTIEAGLRVDLETILEVRDAVPIRKIWT